jgi:hypothetical protein
MIAAGGRSLFAGLWWSQSQLTAPWAFWQPKVGPNACEWLAIEAFQGLMPR